MVWRLLSLAILAPVLAACSGFHLRGELDLPANLRKVQVDLAPGTGELAVELQRTLESRGLRVAGTRKQADFILWLKAVEFHRRVLSVNTRARVREYEISYRLRFSATDRAGATLVREQDVLVLRDYTFDETNVLGKYEEEVLLRQEMAKDALEQMLRRLQSQLRGHSGAKPRYGATAP